MIAILLALVVNTALLTGNEFAVAAFIHPSLSRDNHLFHLSAIQSFARLYGRVMPIWMGITSGLHIFVCVIAWFGAKPAFPWLCAAALIWIIVIPYSLIFPVPLNNQVQKWDLKNLPFDWQQTRQKWDFYNWIRVVLLISAFVLLLLGFRNYS
ncbi:MAG: DUF1772 domain-containing protein [Komarekiella atlantica HA4396-MV6]|jgi:uncharacterized membrane protein|nr:DUF1772 domain-containing protein [Komarekiella atlantica HA4396-MV6]